MRVESNALLKANLELRSRLEEAEKALRFYANGGHFDTVRVDGDPEGEKRTRIIDTGATASDALKSISPIYAEMKGCCTVDDELQEVLSSGQDTLEATLKKTGLKDITELRRAVSLLSRWDKLMAPAADQPEAAVNNYSPWVPPFKSQKGCIFDNEGNKVCDMRGWGFLTGVGGVALAPESAAGIQDAMCERIAGLMNKDAGL